MDDTGMGDVLSRPTSGSRNSAPARSGNTDLARAESAVRELRALDYQFGGGRCQADVAALLDWGEHLIAGTTSGSARERTYRVVADVHNLAGWTAFDVGHVHAALRHFDRAAKLARLGRDPDLVANVFYRAGRVHLHHRVPERALAAFQKGLEAIDGGARSPLAASILHTNQAWAHASMGALGPALTCLAQAEDEFVRAVPAEAPTWARFFDETDFAATAGVIYTELARGVDRCYTAFAVPALADAQASYGPGMTRSKVFTLTALAVNRLLDGDVSDAVDDADAALALAATVDSTRVRDRMAPLRAEVNRQCGPGCDDDLRDLAQRLAVFTHGPAAPVPMAVRAHGTV